MLAEAVHAAGMVYSGTKMVLAILWEIEGFKRPDNIHDQATEISNNKRTHKGVRGDRIKFN